MSPIFNPTTGFYTYKGAPIISGAALTTFNVAGNNITGISDISKGGATFVNWMIFSIQIVFLITPANLSEKSNIIITGQINNIVINNAFNLFSNYSVLSWANTNLTLFNAYIAIQNVPGIKNVDGYFPENITNGATSNLTLNLNVQFNNMIGSSISSSHLYKRRYN